MVNCRCTFDPRGSKQVERLYAGYRGSVKSKWYTGPCQVVYVTDNSSVYRTRTSCRTRTTRYNVLLLEVFYVNGVFSL